MAPRPIHATFNFLLQRTFGDSQGRSQGRFPGVPKPPPPPLPISMTIISRGQNDRNRPFRIPRDEIIAFEEEDGTTYKASHAMLMVTIL